MTELKSDRFWPTKLRRSTCQFSWKSGRKPLQKSRKVLVKDKSAHRIISGGQERSSSSYEPLTAIHNLRGTHCIPMIYIPQYSMQWTVGQLHRKKNLHCRGLDSQRDVAFAILQPAREGEAESGGGKRIESACQLDTYNAATTLSTLPGRDSAV